MKFKIADRYLNLLRSIFVMATIIMGILPVQKLSAQKIVSNKPMVSRQEADSIRIDIMSRELHLSPAESKKFWPYFDEYTSKLQELDRDYFRKVGIFKANIDKLNDEALNQFVENDFTYQQRKLDLKKKYNTLFKSILPLKKLAHYYIAQDQFSRQLIRYRIKKGLNKP